MVKGSFIGLPMIDGGSFSGTGANVSIYTKFAVCVSFIIIDATDATAAITLTKTALNCYTITSAVNGHVYNWIAVGHG